MENAITAGLARQIVLTHAMEATANNIANQTTAGFKSEHIAFREYIARIEVDAAADPTVSLVYDPDSYTDFAEGALEPTYSDLDFAIEGAGFFAVETDAGVRYTRDGRFTLNAFGELVTRDGSRVLDPAGGSILIDIEDGPITATAEGELQQRGAAVGAIGVYTFDDPAALEKRGANLFEAAAEPRALEFPRLRQGYVESSNVNPLSAMTDMIEIVRAYEQAAMILETSSELSRETVRTLSETA